MKKSIDFLSERMKVISEYKWYSANINEADDEPAEDAEAPEGEAMEAGDDLDDELDSIIGGEGGGEEPTDDSMDMGDDMGMEGDSDEIEIDVSEIVDSVEQNADSLVNIDSKIDGFEGQFGSFVKNLMAANDKLVSQMNQLEKNMNQQFSTRTPTPHEQLMLRSMASYPYNIQLSDYWQAKGGAQGGNGSMNPNASAKYDVKIETDEDETPKEYKLTQNDIDKSYSEIDIRKSM